MTNNIWEAGRLYRFFVDKRHLEIRGDLGGGDNDEDVNEDDEINDNAEDCRRAICWRVCAVRQAWRPGFGGLHLVSNLIFFILS